MRLIDSHCHLYLPEFREDAESILERAGNTGVEKFFLPNIDGGTKSDLLALCSRHPQKCFPMMGLHPTSVKENYLSELAEVEKELKSRKYVAVGEVGVDLYWDKTFTVQQCDAFRRQSEMAYELGLPVVIHARNSFPEIFNELDSLGNKRPGGIFHCFTGGPGEVRKILAYGNFYFGIGGVLTYKNSGLDKVLPSIPVNRLVLETDSPYLAPVPHRGKRNEPSYLSFIVEKLAEIYKMDAEKMAGITSNNSLEVFGVK